MAAKSSPRRHAVSRRSARPGDPRFYQGGDYRLDESVGYLLRRVRTGLDRALEAEMAALDLTSAQWGPLFAIERGLANNAAQLSRLARVDTGAMTRLIDRLEAKGLIRRAPCPRDGRVSSLELTPAGRTVCADIPYALSRVLNHTLRGFDASEVAVLRSMLKRMLKNVSEE